MARVLYGCARLGTQALRSNNNGQLLTAVRHYRVNLPDSVRKWMYNLSGFNQYGLYKDDLLPEDSAVKEAIRRLPPQLQDERNYRLMRACQLSLMKTVLPKSEWVTFEEDVAKGRYLQPYLDEVDREMKEEAEWSKR